MGLYDEQNRTLKIDYIEDKIYLKGEKMISSENVRIPKYKVPILAEKRKNNETERMERKSPIQPAGSKIPRRFQVGSVLAGYLENQY